MAPKSRGYRHKDRKEGRRKNQRVELTFSSKNPEEQFLRRQDKKLTVSNLVYEYLRKISCKDSVRKQHNTACNKFRRRNTRKKSIHSPRKYTNADLCRYEPYNSRDYGYGDPDILASSSTPDTTIGRTPSPLTPSSLSALPFPGSLLQPSFLTTMPPLMQSISVPQPFSNHSPGTMVSRHFLGANSVTSSQKRPRSEKKPIPDDQKDEKYFERRKRNNQAAKKSRDARKIREDHIALRATMLEHENAILRAQIITLREEAQSLRHMLIKQQMPALQSIERSISSMTPVTLSPPHSSATLDYQV